MRKLEVAIASNALDLFAPKFGLDALGSPGESIILKVSVLANGKPLTVFGKYTIGSRHAQISSSRLPRVDESVQVSSVNRYSVQDAVSDINQFIDREFKGLRFESVKSQEDLRVRIESKPFSASMSRLYTVGGSLYLVLRVLRKGIRVEFAGDVVRLFDSSRRELAGVTLAGNRLILRRKFQHPELTV